MSLFPQREIYLLQYVVGICSAMSQPKDKGVQRALAPAEQSDELIVVLEV